MNGGVMNSQKRQPAYNKRQLATATQLVADYQAEGVLWEQHGPRLYQRPNYVKSANVPTITCGATVPGSDVDPAGVAIYPLNGVDVSTNALPENKVKTLFRGYNERANIKNNTGSGGNGSLTGGNVIVNTTASGNNATDATIEPGTAWGITGNAYLYDFLLDGDLFFMRSRTGAGAPKFTLLVDGAVVVPTFGTGVAVGTVAHQIITTTGADQYIKVKWSTSARRRIQMVFQDAFTPGALYIRNTATLTANPPKIKWAAFGDSFGQTISDSAAAIVDYAHINMLHARFGLAYDFIGMTVGSTGLATAGQVWPGDPMPYGSNLRPSTRKILQVCTPGLDLDVITAIVGHNDGATYNTALFDTELTAFINDAKALHPNALIFLASSNFSPAMTGGTAAALAIEAKVKAACASLGAFHIPMQSLNPPFLRGTGKQSAQNASGNTDIYTGPDGIHPTIAGHLALGEHVARGVYDGALKVMA
jgi:hypothetical protein